MAMGIKLIDIRVAKPVFAKVKRESHVDKTQVQTTKYRAVFFLKSMHFFFVLKNLTKLDDKNC